MASQTTVMNASRRLVVTTTERIPISWQTTAMNVSGNQTHSSELPLSNGAYIGIAVFLLITGIFGTFSNAVTVIMFVKERFQTSIDILLFNLAITDLGMTGACFPFVVTANFAQRWLIGDVGCTVYGIFGFLFGNCSMMTLSAISIERYFIVCKKHPVSVTRRCEYLVKYLIALWCYSLMWALLPLITGVGYDKEPFGTSCSVKWSGQHMKDKVFIACLVILVVGLNVFVMSFCYISIVYVSVSGLREQRRHRHDFHLTKICFLLITVYLLCWSPYTVVSLWSTFGQKGAVPVWMTVVPVMLCKLSSCVNPFLYILYSDVLRKRLLAVFLCANTNRVDNSESYGLQNMER